jgi:hypothetical protein
MQLKKRLKITALEISEEQEEAKKRAEELGIPYTENIDDADKVEITFYSIDLIMPFPADKSYSIIFSSGNQFLVPVKVENLEKVIEECQK